MASPGKLIEKLFFGRCVEIFIANFDGERIDLSQFSIANKYIVHGKVIKYYDDCDVLELENHQGKSFYINSNNIDAFWEPGLKIMESIGVMIPSGKKLKKDLE